MYSSIERSDKYKESLLAFIFCEYGIEANNLTPARRGFYGETWRLETANTSYFLKLVYPAVHKPVYERSFALVEHLCKHGIDFISRIVKTSDDRLFSQFDGAVLGVFDWIDGENIETDETKVPEYQMLAKVYSVPPVGVSIPLEGFSSHNADRFYKEWDTLQDRQLRLLFEKNRIKLEYRAVRLKHFSTLCRDETSSFVITHGDAGGNLIKNGNSYHIVDWDNAILAPPERDAWVMCSREWARDAFHNALCNNGIDYTLRPERLAYYCYDFFFFYLNAFLDACAQADTIEEYLNGWITESFKFADEIPG